MVISKIEIKTVMLIILKLDYRLDFTDSVTFHKHLIIFLTVVNAFNIV